jgi:hypothetical protein
MKQPSFTITVSWIKNTYLRRAALLATLPFCLVIALGQATIIWLLVVLTALVAEPLGRLFEVGCVMRALAPTFKEQWRKK